MNKMIDGKQCTIGWHVDDLKISHVSEEVCKLILDKLNSRYGKIKPLVATHGKIHEYIGMTVDYSEPGKVKFSTVDFIKQTVAEAPQGLIGGIASTPAAKHLFDVNPNAEKLSAEDSEIFHRFVAKLLWVCKRTRPDIQLAVSFLTTRVQSPDVDDWKKLGRCLTYLRDNAEDVLTLAADDISVIRWWIDAFRLPYQHLKQTETKH